MAYLDMVSSIFTIFISFYLGAWCDLFGRKPLIYMFWVAKIINQALILLQAIFLKMKKAYIYLATLPVTLVGRI